MFIMLKWLQHINDNVSHVELEGCWAKFSDPQIVYYPSGVNVHDKNGAKHRYSAPLNLLYLYKTQAHLPILISFSLWFLSKLLEPNIKHKRYKT